MKSPLDRQRSFEFRLRFGLLLLVCAFVVAALSPALAAAAAEESEGPPTVEPVIVPEAEVPVTPAATAPETGNSAPAPAPSAKPTESSATSAPATHTTTHSTPSSGGSGSAPTAVNHSVRGPSSSGPVSNGNSGSGDGSSASSSPSPSTESAASSPTSSLSPSNDVGKVASALGTLGGHARAKGKQGRQEALGHLGSAVGKALIGSQVQVAAPPHKDQLPAFVPLPGKSKLLYFVLILAVMAVAALVVWLQFRGPRESRRWKATMDHRTSARLSPAERARARADSRRWAAAERTPRPRRKAA